MRSTQQPTRCRRYTRSCKPSAESISEYARPAQYPVSSRRARSVRPSRRAHRRRSVLRLGVGVDHVAGLELLRRQEDLVLHVAELLDVVALDVAELDLQ